MSIASFARPALAAALLLSLASPGAAQIRQETAGAAAKTLTAAEADGVVSRIIELLRSGYVFPAKAPAIADAVDKARRSGRYRTDDAALLAERLTQDLGRASGDAHLYLNYNPAQYAAAMADRRSGSDEAEDALLRDRVAREHHGLAELRILPGNLRYLRITEFEWLPDATGAAYDDAMRFLRDGDAIIIDLRGTPGGSSSAVQYLVSHFLAPDTLELTFLESGKPPVETRALPYLPAGRVRDRPLYVLIDGGTGSAAEGFAYDVAQFKLGELVGARTVGAANNNRFEPIAPGFMLSLPYGRPVHPVSGGNWEGRGVSPTVAVPPAEALDKAQALALTKLAQAPGPHRAEYEWALAGVQGRLAPPSLTPDDLARRAGAYGEISVRFRDGHLWLARPDRPERRLIPLTADGLFAVEGSDRLRVRFVDQELQLLALGAPEARRYARSG